MSHIDPATGTNPFFEGVGYTPGHHFVDRDLGPEQPVAAVEELLATAIVDLPDVLSQGCDAEVRNNSLACTDTLWGGWGASTPKSASVLHFMGTC